MYRWFKSSLFLIFFTLLTINTVDAQVIKRQSINSLGASTVIPDNDILVRQTIGQPFFTLTNQEGNIYFLPGFQQPLFAPPEKEKTPPEVMNGVEVYPNPATNKIIVVPQLKIRNAALKVNDMDGQLIFQTKTSLVGNHTIDCSNWESGTYLLAVYDKAKNQHFFKKIIISK